MVTRFAVSKSAPLSLMKSKVLAAVLVAGVAVPGIAFADGTRNHGWAPLPIGVTIEAHVHSGDCHHASPLPPAPPPGIPVNQGRYELQTVQHWVPGYFTEVWVPEQCVSRHSNRDRGHGRGYGRGHGGKTVCRAGYSDKQWVEGRYENTQEWVWVQPTHRSGWYGAGSR